MKIVLIGFMTSGKSTVGKLLAKKLYFDFIDTDAQILGLSNFSSISEMFADVGEAYFRNQESSLCDKLLSFNNVVIATGGGFTMYADNFQKLHLSKSFFVYLKVSFEEVLRRASLDENPRPLLQDQEKAHSLYLQRENRYREQSNMSVVVDNKDVSTIVDEISHSISAL
jgi:shikimate kinase